eukprot:tig00000900_g5363.t1
MASLMIKAYYGTRTRRWRWRRGPEPRGASRRCGRPSPPRGRPAGAASTSTTPPSPALLAEALELLAEARAAEWPGARGRPLHHVASAAPRAASGFGSAA